MKTSRRKRTAYDLSHVKSVTVWTILRPSGGLGFAPETLERRRLENGEPIPASIVGKIVANYSDNPNGSVCTATVSLYDRYAPAGSIGNRPYTDSTGAKHDSGDSLKGTGSAGGYGYDKFSAAVADALTDAGQTDVVDVAGVGESAIRRYFAKHGYMCEALV